MFSCFIVSSLSARGCAYGCLFLRYFCLIIYPQGKRIVVFGLPRSGAALMTHLIAQRPNAVAITNLFPGVQVLYECVCR